METQTLILLLSVATSSLLCVLTYIRTKRQYSTSGTTPIIPEKDFSHLIANRKGTSQEDREEELEIFRNVLDFSHTRVRDCMVPRPEIVGVPRTATRQELTALFVETGFSKLIVYDGSIDNILGYIHVSEMFHSQGPWTEHIQKMPFVPGTMGAQNMLTQYDTDRYVAKQTAKGEYVFSARLEIEKINEDFALQLPLSQGGEYQTLGGLILHYHQSFPKLHEEILIGPYRLKVLKMTAKKIELVRISRTPDEEQ